jgi:hypothetical protein
MDSILTTIKKLLGIEESDSHFDVDIITHINSVFMILNQLGIGPSEGFVIEDNMATWSDYLPDKDLVKLSAVKTFIHLKVRLLFDPPAGTVAEHINKQLSELEWRLNVIAEETKIESEKLNDDFWPVSE